MYITSKVNTYNYNFKNNLSSTYGVSAIVIFYTTSKLLTKKL